MKRLIIAIILAIFPCSPIRPQQVRLLPLQDFLNNHTTTTAISFSTNGKYLLTGGFAKLYDISDLTQELSAFRTLEKDTETTDDISYNAVISPDGYTFILVKNKRIEVWDLKSIQAQKPVKLVRDNKIIFNAVCFSAEGKTVYYMRKNGDLVSIDFDDFKQVVCSRVKGGKPTSLSLSPDHVSLLVGTSSGQIFLIDSKTFLTTSIKPEGLGKILHIRSSADGRHFAVLTQNGIIWLGSFPSMKKVSSWDSQCGKNGAIAFHPSGQYLASGGQGGKILIWSIPAGSAIYSFKAHSKDVVSLAFSSKGSHLASGSRSAVLALGEDTKLWQFDAPVATVVKEEGIVAADNREKRLALVIGNGNYLYSILANPENDARSMQSALKKCGFEVIEHENLGMADLQSSITEFGNRLKNYQVGLVFYAGHGIQIDGYNYLIPVDAGLRSEEQVSKECLQADKVLNVMKSSGARVIIFMLDACRNNPFERNIQLLKKENEARGETVQSGNMTDRNRKAAASQKTRGIEVEQGKGLAAMKPSGGTFIAYAADMNQTASDGTGRNGLWTTAILKNITTPDISIEEMFRKVAKDLQESESTQVPFIYSSLTETFFFCRSGSR